MPTIREVAELAGVSPTTVSHVANETRPVSEDVRARVLAAMEELGYQPNALARSLRRGQTTTIGLILPDSVNPFFAEVARSVETAAFKLGYSVILCNTEENLEKERFYVDVLSKKRVDGFIFVAAGDRPESLRVLLNTKTPVVVIDRDLPGIEADAVVVDNLQGGRLATQHLLHLGHRRIACIAGPSHLTPSNYRLTGYQQALTEAGLAVDEGLIVRGDFHPESGRVITHALLQRAEPPTAIFACNDLMAIGSLRAAAEAGRRVPADLALVGFDNIDMAAYTTPPLTTIASPKLEMGRMAVELLTGRIRDKLRLPRRELLPTRLVVRGSCGGQA